MNGSLDFVFDSFLVVSRQAKSNNVRMPAITSARHSQVMLHAATFVKGVMPAFDFAARGRSAAPAGTDRQIIALLNSELNQVLADNSLKHRFPELAGTPQPTNPEGFGPMVRGEALRREPVMKAAGVSPEQIVTGNAPMEWCARCRGEIALGHNTASTRAPRAVGNRMVAAAKTAVGRRRDGRQSDRNIPVVNKRGPNHVQWSD